MVHRDHIGRLGVDRPAGGRRAAQLDEHADTWLVTQAKAGDVHAYEELVRRHRGRIYRIALRMLDDRHDAEDVTQDVVLQVWTALAGFTGSSSFTTWLYRVVVNRCLNQVRRNRVPCSTTTRRQRAALRTW